MFAYELDRRLRERGLRVVANAVHPGVVNTELFRQSADFGLATQTLSVSQFPVGASVRFRKKVRSTICVFCPFCSGGGKAPKRLGLRMKESKKVGQRPGRSQRNAKRVPRLWGLLQLRFFLVQEMQGMRNATGGFL